LDPWVAVGSGLAVVLTALRCIGPGDWKRPGRWRIPDVAATFFVIFGANAVTGAIKLGRLLVLGRIVIASHGATTVSLGTDDAVLFIGGVIAGAVVGLITVRDGLSRMVA
jgi:hypothetical protein